MTTQHESQAAGVASTSHSPCHHVLLHAPKVRPWLRRSAAAAAAAAAAVASVANGPVLLLLLLMMMMMMPLPALALLLLLLLLVALTDMTHPLFRITPAQHSNSSQGVT
jgi:hypothetical protein